MNGAWLAALACGLAPAAADARQVEATYLANEGVLLRAGQVAVLVDALFGDGLAGYPVVAADERARLERSAPPFDDVTLVLATHRHRDHFEPAAAARFLAANARAHLLSTPQVVDELREALRAVVGGEAIGARIHSTLPEPGVLEHHQLGGVAVRAARLHHGVGSEVENLGFLIELGGVRVLHVGDTEATADDLAPLGLSRLDIDLALLPVWYYSHDALQRAVREQIRPRHGVAFHFAVAAAPAQYHGPAASLEELAGRVAERAPGVEVWTRPGQRLVVSAAPARQRRPDG